MSCEEWYSVKSSYENVLKESNWQHTYLSHMPWLIDQIIESKYGSKFFPGLSHMNLSIHPTEELRTPHRRIIIYPKASWFTLHYSYLGDKDVYRYDLYKVVLEEVKNILLQLMERLEKWKVENSSM